MNGTFDIRSESHIEVHKFRAGAIIIATLLALVIQASFPIHFARAAILDLPLLVTIYFGLSRRNPSTLAARRFRWGFMASRKLSSGISLLPSARGWTPNIPRRGSRSPPLSSWHIKA